MFTTIRSVRGSRVRARRRLVMRLVGCAWAAFLTGGCSDDDSGATGTVVMRVGDSPYPFDMVTAAEVTIDRVEVRVLGDDKTQFPGAKVYAPDELRTIIAALLVRAGGPDRMTVTERANLAVITTRLRDLGQSP